VRATIQAVVDEELERLVGAGPYERHDERVDVRNGTYPRRVLTTLARSSSGSDAPATAARLPHRSAGTPAVARKSTRPSRSPSRAGLAYVLRHHAVAAADRCASLSRKHVSPHVLRHTCALTILQATGDLRKVSLWLGHADMQTTMTYLRADPSEKLATVTAVVPMPGRRIRLRAPDKLIASLHRR
jgi:integrase